MKRINLLKRVLVELGLEDDRVRLAWISGSEGKRFAEEMTAFDSKIRELGPNPLKGGANV